MLPLFRIPPQAAARVVPSLSTCHTSRRCVSQLPPAFLDSTLSCEPQLARPCWSQLAVSCRRDGMWSSAAFEHTVVSYLGPRDGMKRVGPPWAMRGSAHVEAIVPCRACCPVALPRQRRILKDPQVPLAERTAARAGQWWTGELSSSSPRRLALEPVAKGCWRRAVLALLPCDWPSMRRWKMCPVSLSLTEVRRGRL